MNTWHDIEYGDSENLNTIIEIPKLSRVKYELDKKTGLIMFDRVLYSPMQYPTNYGFVPRTLWEDGDPLDILVLTHEALVPGCLVQTRPIGVLEMEDDGESDSKILSVPTKDPRFNNTKDISDIEPHLLKEIKHFFEIYKDLQNKEVKVGEWLPKEEAIKTINQAVKQYNEKYK